MQPISPQVATLLALSSRRAVAEVLVQLPNPANNLQPAGQILLDGVTSLSITKSEESVSDTIDFQIANGDGRYSPLVMPTLPTGKGWGLARWGLSGWGA